MTDIVVWRDIEAKAIEQLEAELTDARIVVLKEWLREKDRLRAIVKAAAAEEDDFLRAFTAAKDKPLTEPMGRLWAGHTKSNELLVLCWEIRRVISQIEPLLPGYTEDLLAAVQRRLRRARPVPRPYRYR